MSYPFDPKDLKDDKKEKETQLVEIKDKEIQPESKGEKEKVEPKNFSQAIMYSVFHRR